MNDAQPITADAEIAPPDTGGRVTPKVPDDVGRVTPMMEQYIEIKAANPDCLLFYRMGDFYEMFFDDAEIASRALGIVLTKRGKHQGRDIPMCGVPIERADEYLHRLIALGHRVAVCEQLEDPAEAKKRGNKSVVRRDVVRLVTPGTLTEDSLLDARRNNYLLALARSRASSSEDRFALSWIDISTGEFRVAECDRGALSAEIARIEPGEIIVSDALYADAELAPYLRSLPALTPLPRDVFDGATAERRLASYFAVATTEAFGTFSRIELTAAAAAVTYVERTQIGKRPPLSPPVRERAGATLAIDPATRANLELSRTLTGDRRGSLLAAIDRTVTAAGSRALAQRLAAPLTDPAEIAHRLDAVAAFVADGAACSALRKNLEAVPDLQRALSRIVVGRGGPRDLAAIRDGIFAAKEFSAELTALARHGVILPRDLAEAAEGLRRPDPALAAELQRALADELPAYRRDGGFVRASYEPALDEARALRDESRRVIAALQVRYADDHRHPLAEDQAQQRARLFRRRHRAERRQADEPAAQRNLYPSPDHRRSGALHHHGTRRTGSQDRQRRRPRAGARVRDLRSARRRGDGGERRHQGCGRRARRDRCGDRARQPRGRTRLCAAGGRRKPRFRHLRAGAIRWSSRRLAAARPFVANDCDLSPPPYPPPHAGEEGVGAGRIWLVTGPNMAGKSTFLRQNALIAVLAQMGSYVPARAAHIGVVDRLFSRVGAADDLARGRSTFMVEMVETAAILNQAGERALVILDEIGRGTATFDGLSIAWAAIEHLHEQNRCRALFATHFHEMTALAQKLPRLHNATMRVKEWQGEVVFLHEVVAGAADRSYGIQVAKLAGLPSAVIERAKLVLAQLEAQDRTSPAHRLIDDLPLFAAARPAAPPTERDAALTAVVEALVALHPDEMTPREALEALYALKGKLKP